MSEQRQRFLEDHQLNYYSVTELAERFSISRKTAHTHPGHQGKWINRYKEHGQSGFHERSRRPRSCPWQTDAAIVEEVVKLRKAHPRWGPRKLLDLMVRRNPRRELPSVSTGARILAREGLVKPRRRYRRAHPGCPKTTPQGPNDICLHLRRKHRWAADYKGQFRLKNGKYCFPLTVSDLSSRYLLGCDAHPAISLERTFTHFKGLFGTYGLPSRIRTDNGVPFASNALARLSQLSVWFTESASTFGIKLGIYPELWNIPRFLRGLSPGSRSKMGCTSGCTARSSRRPRSLLAAACAGSSGSSIGSGRNSTRSGRTKPWR
ncbi:MAG: helix-turn-helix domain containing protein [Chloroflexi bacterium]|nr:helix-turn-helix domain containing protein [Chloroflexota bacterium]